MRQYMGVTIERAGMNASGIRWTASMGTGRVLKADTLAGIKELIRRERFWRTVDRITEWLGA